MFGYQEVFDGFIALLQPQSDTAAPLSPLPSPTDATTATNSSTTLNMPFALPVTVLESFVPGYGIIRNLLLDILGIDISILVSIIGFCFLLRTASTYTWDYASDFISDYITVRIDFGEHDEVFDPLLKYLVENGHTKRARSLKAAGRWWDRIMDSKKGLLEMSEKAHARHPDRGRSTAIYNHDTLESKRPLGYEPDEGHYRFWRNGRIYFLRLYKMTYQYRHEEYVRVTISTLGWDTEKLKQFLEDVRASEDDNDAETDFFRADPNDTDWNRVATRPSRPLNTVALDTAEKLRLVRDMNDFIHPTRAKWYSSRGIPYRRGYLFSGPPGTGKTSLSLALAGVFGLGLYALSLQDSGMTEERLTQLFDYLPDRCVVLLEDIDTAGVGEKRDDTCYSPSSSTQKPNTAAGASTPNPTDATPNTNEKTKHDPTKKKPTTISLASLLNAIDGVASHEGHVLIMTTNHPSQLDPALKRPGRVDMHIAFSLATKFQAKEIYLRMFTDEVEIENAADGAAAAAAAGKALVGRETLMKSWVDALPFRRTNFLGLGQGRERRGPRIQTVEEVCQERSELAGSRICPFMSLEELDGLADEFVRQMPEEVFSPAEIQGYLLLYKSEPGRAVEDLGRWMGESGKLGVKEVGVVERVKMEDDEDSGVEVEVGIEGAEVAMTAMASGQSEKVA